MATERHTLIEELERISTRVRALDLEAGQLLHEKKDREGYRRKLLEKAGLLASLPELIRDGISVLPEEGRGDLEEAIAEIAEDAMRAMAIDSVFYMSVLLLPGEGQPEGPNDLERVIAWLGRG